LAEAGVRRALAILVCAGAVVLVVAAAGLVPAREPAPPERLPFAVEKTLPVQSPLARAALAPKPGPKGKAQFARPALPIVPLCEAPERGARWYKLELAAGQTSLLVWCKQGYELFGLRSPEHAAEAASAASTGTALRVPEVVRLARFKARAELPGGAVAGDFDGDGQLDLVLGVAAGEGVVHRSGAGVYWLRGRAQGGFELARALAETSSVAVAAQPLVAGVGHELVLLTAGDVAAQRPGELWSFTRTPALVRQRVVPVGLDPRGLALRASGEPQRIEAWVLSGQPGRLERLVLDLATHDVRPEQTSSLALRGAQALAHEPSAEGALFVRDATSIQRVERGAAPHLAAYAEGAHVGPFALTDLDGDLKLDVLAALDDGVAWLNAGAPAQEHALPSELKVLDVETLRLGNASTPLALVRGPEPGVLSLLLLPRPPWSAADTGPAQLSRSEPHEAASVASVALE
jgi:hypothetical protein